MDAAGLHDGLRPDGVDRVGQALEAVADHDAGVGDAAVLQLGQHPQPVLGALGAVAGPHPQDLPLSLDRDGEGEVDRAVGDLAVADLHMDRVDEDHRVDRVQRSGLPLDQALDDAVGDRGDGGLGNLDAVRLGQVGGDLAVGEALRRERDHQVVDAGQASGVLGHDRRREGPVAVPGDRDGHRPDLGGDGLGAAAVARVPAVPSFDRVLRIAEVIVYLALERCLEHELRQLLQQAPGAGQREAFGAGPVGQPTYQLRVQLVRTAHTSVGSTGTGNPPCSLGCSDI